MVKALEQYIRKLRLVRPGERVGIAVSGGADSVALLRAFLELAPGFGVVPFVLHLNHRLRGAESDADEQFVRDLAAQHNLEAAIESEDVSALATLFHLSLEAAGRRARYAFFQKAAAALRLNAVATAHTRDDQAETVLLRLMRGAGTNGLAGIHSSFEFSRFHVSTLDNSGDNGSGARIIRPLLATSRREVEEYLNLLGQSYRQDSSNQSPEYTRNRVRSGLLPSLERDYNPRLRQALSDTAEIAAAENEFFDRLTDAALGPDPDPEQGIELESLTTQPIAMQRRLLRRVCRYLGLSLDFAHLEELREFALAGRAEQLALPKGYVAQVVRDPQGPSRLFLFSAEAEAAEGGYSLELPFPGSVQVGGFFGGPETAIRATVLNEDSAKLVYHRADLLRAADLNGPLVVRNLQAGDRFLPLFSKGEEKVTRLLQRLMVTGAVRKNWPVVLSRDQVLWAPGLPVAKQFAWTPGDGNAIAIDVCSTNGNTCNTLTTGRSALAQLSFKTLPLENYDVVVSQAQLQARIAALGRRISHDYEGRAIYCIGVLENGFIFLADLLRSLHGDVRCQFVRTNVREINENNISTTEIFYTPELDVDGQHVLLCDGIVSSGLTTEFLVRNLKARGAASISVCALLDRQSARRVDLDVTYYGFQVGPQWLAGFGLGAPTRERNLPFIFAAPELGGLCMPRN
ncbi:MAG: tRNA lysidine(34) synthetase TilS [Acidobacteriota bacterium]|nr:tRNA lysidine(34) synthetase TilS [Acidobacteriota bacterium]